MATAEAAIVAVLQADATVAALIGTRVYPEVLPQNVQFPCVRYQRISTSRSPYRKLATGRADYARPRMQVDCWALSKGAVVQLAEAVRGALDGYSGTSAGLVIGSSQNEDEDSDLEPGVGPNGADVYRHRLDFMIGHTE